MSSRDWKELKLSEVCQIKYGKDHKNLSNGKIPVYGSGGIMRYVDSFLNDKPSVLIPRKGTLSNLYFVNEKFWTVDTLFWTKIDETIVIPEFLYYQLLTKDLANMNVGSAVPSLTAALLNELRIKLPSLKTQHAITGILSSLDKKIELNIKVNKVLEGMAQAIFKSWFIDFEPFGNDEFIKNENGNIPRKWEVKKLRDVCKIQKGLSYKGKHLKIFGTPMINLGCVEPGGDFRSNKMKYYDGEYKSQHTVNPGDIVIANTDMTSDRVILGSPIIVPEFDFSTIIFTHHLFAFKDLKISREYLYYFLKSETFRKRAEGYANGTTVLSLSKEDILSIDLLVPDNITLEKFTSIAEKLIKLKQNNDQENLKLEKIRESLLPKLISGEIQVTTEVNTNAEVR